MTDRGSPRPGARFRLSIPPLTWRVLDAAVAAGLTVAFTLLIMVVNGFLAGKGSYQQGFDAWLLFIKRPDIIGTLIVSVGVTAAYLFWRRPRG